MRVFAFPSSMLPVCMSALPSTTTATVFLIASSNSSSSVGACPGLTTCLILIGSCLALLPTALFVFLWVRYAQGPSAIWTCVPRGLSTSPSKTTKGAAEIAVGESRAVHKNNDEVGDDADSGRGGPVSSPLYGILERVRRRVVSVTVRSTFTF
ncbi:membrane-associated protein, putative, partial [Bodo saltans]